MHRALETTDFLRLGNREEPEVFDVSTAGAKGNWSDPLAWRAGVV